MPGATSKSLATVTLLLLPFDVLTVILRFRARLARKVWGSDDWAMLVSLPFFIATTVSMVTLAFSGLGLRDDELQGDQMREGLFWYFLSGTIWTFWVTTLKWSIGFTILRIAVGKRWVVWSIYVALVMVTLTSISTGVFQLVQCKPMNAIWDADALAHGGECINRKYLAAMSTTLAAVSIATDWYMALIPIPLMWNLQMERRIKLSIGGLLGLGVFASIAGIVRFATIVRSTPAIASGKDYLHILDPIMTWAHAEPAIGMVAANLPALRPLLERALAFLSTLRSRPHTDECSAEPPAPKPSNPLALGAVQDDGDKGKGNDTRIMEGYGRDVVRSSPSDDESQADVIRSQQGARVKRKISFAERARRELEIDPAYKERSFAISKAQDDVEVRRSYRPFLLDEETSQSDWVSQLELSTVLKMVEDHIHNKGQDRLRVLVLHGSMRNRSYSRLLSYEASRILFRLGCDVRMYDPKGLPVKDDEQHSHPKVQELRELSKWSDGHIWISPEQHGNVTAVFKNQIDWIPLSTGSVRPTQGRTLAIAQVSGGSQSFNTVNTLRILGRWMRMFAIPNQSSIPMAYKQFTEPEDVEGGSRLMPSGNRDRLVDCMEEFVKYTLVMRPHFDLFGDRYSEREEKRSKAAKEEKLAAATSQHQPEVVAPDLKKL
ncbi:hypothetical protein E8E13_005049 [Curvularia kusanoi]|uniref:NADPH-dependent FMN reductase-like domain-containing protein n=1 Tax=Curvularia kusanoi TaxID=90978 RepID=A0A9P4WAI6_CURKU|nr:hypothetical protein E8E13_005049 [Curvularia kusanoi]